MARRDEYEGFGEMMFELLVLLPWWAGPVVAGVVYVGVRWGIGAMLPADGGPPHPLMGIQAMWPTVSFWAMVFVLALWVAALMAKMVRWVEGGERRVSRRR